MNIFLKFFFIFCFVVTSAAICATVYRFYQTEKVFMFFLGIVSLIFLLLMLYSSISVLFVKGGV